MACQLRPAFAALRDLIPQTVGECLTPEAIIAETGDVIQPTTGGTMIWRKADDRAAFTDGATTWIIGPNGLESRSNGERFPWETP